jgi:hypothetical protein
LDVVQKPATIGHDDNSLVRKKFRYRGKRVEKKLNFFNSLEICRSDARASYTMSHGVNRNSLTTVAYGTVFILEENELKRNSFSRLTTRIGTKMCTKHFRTFSLQKINVMFDVINSKAKVSTYLLYTVLYSES